MKPRFWSNRAQNTTDSYLLVTEKVNKDFSVQKLVDD